MRSKVAAGDLSPTAAGLRASIAVSAISFLSNRRPGRRQAVRQRHAGNLQILTAVRHAHQDRDGRDDRVAGGTTTAVAMVSPAPAPSLTSPASGQRRSECLRQMTWHICGRHNARGRMVRRCRTNPMARSIAPSEGPEPARKISRACRRRSGEAGMRQRCGLSPGGGVEVVLPGSAPNQAAIRCRAAMGFDLCSVALTPALRRYLEAFACWYGILDDELKRAGAMPNRSTIRRDSRLRCRPPPPQVMRAWRGALWCRPPAAVLHVA